LLKFGHKVNLFNENKNGEGIGYISSSKGLRVVKMSLTLILLMWRRWGSNPLVVVFLKY
jgi:hypothetical protein